MSPLDVGAPVAASRRSRRSGACAPAAVRSATSSCFYVSIVQANTLCSNMIPAAFGTLQRREQPRIPGARLVARAMSDTS